MADTTTRARPEAIAERYVTEFRDHGFTHVPALLTPQEVDRYRTAAWDAIEQHSTSSGMGGGRGTLKSTTDTWWKPGILRDLARHPRIGAAAEQLVGMPLRLWGGEAWVKRPHDDAPTIWHDDLTLLPLDARMSLNAWIALVDVPVERGPLTFLPRSQDRPAPYRLELTGAGISHSYLFDQWPDLGWSPQVTVPLRAGDVTFHQSRIGHRGNGNASDETRLAFITNYTDTTATYQPLPGYHRKYLEAGQVLPDDQYPRIADLG